MWLRELIMRRRLGAERSRPPGFGRATTARRNRTAAIAALQPEVRRLQQAIADLGETQIESTARDVSTVDAQLSVLQVALARAQTELARYQGRI